MDRENFNIAVNRLFFHFQASKPPDSDTMEIWYKKVMFVPNEALDFIVSRFEDERDSIRCNITKAFKDYWRIWLQENPNRRASEFQETPCKDCQGRGVLFFEYFNGTFGRDYSAVCRCARCHNWRKHFPPDTTVPAIMRYQLEKNGCTIKYV